MKWSKDLENLASRDDRVSRDIREATRNSLLQTTSLDTQAVEGKFDLFCAKVVFSDRIIDFSNDNHKKTHVYQI